MPAEGSADGDGMSRFHEESASRQRNLHPIAALKLMTVRTRHHRLTTRPRLGRRTASAAGTIALGWQPPGQPQPFAPQARERDAGGPEDRAAYSCSCGHLFEAPVSTTVGCPHCGGTQAW
jgi:hypothetical protein